MYPKKILLFIFIFFFFLKLSVAQLKSEFFKEDHSILPENKNRLYLGFYNLNFLKNMEYFSDIPDGYTLYGYQLLPKLIYFPNENLRIDLGFYLLKDFGRNRFSEVAPDFSAKYVKNDMSLIFGNIEADNQHKLVEPMFDFERVLHKRLEYGSQIILDKSPLWLDGWINWEKYLEKGDPFQEQLTAGMSTIFHLTQKESKLKFNIPFQFMLTHRGGQIDADTMPLETIFNSSFGANMEYSINEKTSLWFSTYYCLYRELSPTKQRPFSKGSGLLYDLCLHTHNLDIILEYWNAYKFIGSRGNQIYQTYSTKTDSVKHTNRNLILLRLNHESKLVGNFYTSIRLEPYYDLEAGMLEYAYGIYAVYRQMFLLKKDVVREDN